MEVREQQRKLNQDIIKLKIKVRRTNDLAIQYFEGELTAEEYEPIRIQRRAWRNEIKALENELQGLEVSHEHCE